MSAEVSSETPGPSSCGYFVSEAHKYIYWLTELDGLMRRFLLGVTPRHFSDSELAASWYRGIVDKIHPDLCAHPLAANAMERLDWLYDLMMRET